jgi:tRNA-specific 2-thiouridylase
MFYTLGQRQGLRIGGRKEKSGSPWYVADKQLARNTLIVVQGHDHPQLFSTALACTQLHWINDCPLNNPLYCTAKTRFRQVETPCLIKPSSNDKYLVEFEIPQRAITPGQSVVFYQGQTCLGGGVIDATV